ncbi:hypothetical protein BGX26_004219 [Mortierella sp. AD094]|nr:hypothetical protein BGX26_004219 [Mortierella sp. AD094]
MTSGLKLFCILEGDSTAFSGKVEPDDTVDDLKGAIKKKQSLLFDDIRAREFLLYSVAVPDEGIPVNLINVESKILLTKSTNEISEVFGTAPPKKTIHVIVQRPLADAAYTIPYLLFKRSSQAKCRPQAGQRHHLVSAEQSN